MKRGSDPDDVFRFHARIGGIHFAGLTGREVDDRMSNNRHDDQEQQSLKDIPYNKRPHDLYSDLLALLTPYAKNQV